MTRRKGDDPAFCPECGLPHRLRERLVGPNAVAAYVLRVAVGGLFEESLSASARQLGIAAPTVRYRLVQLEQMGRVVMVRDRRRGRGDAAVYAVRGAFRSEKRWAAFLASQGVERGES